MDAMASGIVNLSWIRRNFRCHLREGGDPAYVSAATLHKNWIPDVQIFQDLVLKNASGMTEEVFELWP